MTELERARLNELYDAVFGGGDHEDGMLLQFALFRQELALIRRAVYGLIGLGVGTFVATLLQALLPK